jgi:cbb3-type cytochrome oxidase subunit 3
MAPATTTPSTTTTAIPLTTSATSHATTSIPQITTVTVTCSLAPSGTACLVKPSSTLNPQQSAALSRNAGILTAIILVFYFLLFSISLTVYLLRRKRRAAIEAEIAAEANKLLLSVKVIQPLALKGGLAGVGVVVDEQEVDQERGRKSSGAESGLTPFVLAQNWTRSVSPTSNFSRYSRLSGRERERGEAAELAELSVGREGGRSIREGERAHLRNDSSGSGSGEEIWYPEWYSGDGRLRR